MPCYRIVPWDLGRSCLDYLTPTTAPSRSNLIPNQEICLLKPGWRGLDVLAVLGDSCGKDMLIPSGILHPYSHKTACNPCLDQDMCISRAGRPIVLSFNLLVVVINQ